MLYPLYIIMCLSMARNLRAWLQQTILAEYVPLTSLQNLHVWAGTWIGVVIMWHALWHLIRWGVQDNLSFLFHTKTGVTGFISLIITPLLVWPMRLQWLRQKISFEVRKRIHYLSWVWAASIAFHAPEQHILYIVGISLLIYVMDWIYGVFMTTHVAPSARFVRLESVVMIRVSKPEGFQMKGSSGYCYICVPWISKYEWHAFSAFKDPVDTDYVCFVVAAVGDWTKKLHGAVTEPIDRRICLYGPFPSPFEMASDSDHILSIASGIGITAALSVIQSLADTRKMRLIWICRDASLLEFVLDYGAKFDDDAYSLIFYTGKREPVFRRSLPYNVFLLKGRPDLEKLIPSLIKSAQSTVLPNVAGYEGICGNNKPDDIETSPCPALEHQFYAEITRLLLTYSIDELFNAAVRRSHVNRRRVTFEGLHDLMQSVFT
jgi:ferric-chelate reductase